MMKTARTSARIGRRTTVTLSLAATLTALALAGCAADSPRGGDGTLVAEDGTVEWNRYHSHADAVEMLHAFAELYPELTELYTIGESYEGQDLWLMEITNEATGPAAEKPALYVDGGLHASELTGSEVALYVLAHLLNGYGDDAGVTELLDTRAFYIRPKFNPDGSDLSLLDDQLLRSSVRPWDEDDDGEMDEDPPEDLDGDGRILRMRVQDPDGGWVASEADPRIMERRQDGDTGPFYRLEREGIDNDGDGRLNEDGYGGLDLNRNYPRNWEPEYLQPGAGPFPLSEPETYAAVEFINAHKNITGIVHGHTSGGFVYRLPSASNPETFDRTDIALIERLGEVYTQTTDRPVRPSSTHPTDHRYGTLISWGYWDEGMIGWVPEYSPGPEEWVTDYDGDGEITEAEEHRFNDEELGGRYFQDWTPYDHPDLGDVEIGGWHSKFWGQNPPAEHLEPELEQQVPWILYLAAQTPMLEVSGPAMTALDDDRFRVEVTVTNTGYLPTNLTERGHVGRETGDGELVDQIVPPPVAILALDGAEIEAGEARTRVGHLAGSTPHSRAVTESSRTVSWTVRRTEPDATVGVTVESVKAGTVRSERVPLAARVTVAAPRPERRPDL